MHRRPPRRSPPASAAPPPEARRREKLSDAPKRASVRTRRPERAEKKPERSEKKPAGENRSARRGGEKPPVSAAPAGDKAERTDKPRRNNHRRRKPRPKTDGEAKLKQSFRPLYKKGGCQRS